MKLLTYLYPVFENKLPDGTYEYGFVTGEKGDSGLFENSSFITRIFDKKQKFSFLSPEKTIADFPELIDSGNKKKKSPFICINAINSDSVSFE